MVDALARLAPIVIQAMFVSDANHEVENCGQGPASEWLAAVVATHATAAHIYTLDRSPALSTLRPVSARRLREIAEQVRTAGVPAAVFVPGRRETR